MGGDSIGGDILGASLGSSNNNRTYRVGNST